MKIDDTASDISFINTTCMQLKMFSNVKVTPTEYTEMNTQKIKIL